jgi:hypothetical protein
MLTQRTPYFRVAAALLALLGLFDWRLLGLQKSNICAKISGNSLRHQPPASAPLAFSRP